MLTDSDREIIQSIINKDVPLQLMNNEPGLILYNNTL